uniref:ADP-ribosylation factor-like protein 2-binding protein n=1 Tax=Falco tinnunculus TaxID=100819 RepID=A0A8C4UX75_FALTI
FSGNFYRVHFYSFPSTTGKKMPRLIFNYDDFQLTQRTFMEKHYREFDDSEEYKLIYTFIFNEYISIVKKYMEEKLLNLIPGFDMTAFTMSLQHKDEMASELFDMLLTFTDFPAFKEMFLDYKAVSMSRCVFSLA